MTRYELFKWLHVMGGITWLGAGIGLAIVSWRLQKAGDHDTIVAIYKREQDLSNFMRHRSASPEVGTERDRPRPAEQPCCRARGCRC